MSLVDLLSDLEKFKYNQTSPDKIDSQIEKGVDNFPNTDASGFTPKTDLESLYHKVKEGNVGDKWPGAAPSYEKNRFETFDHYEIPKKYKSKLVLKGDGFYSTWEDTPQFTSPFMETPSDYISKYSQPHTPSLTFTVPSVKSSMDGGLTNVGDIPEQTFGGPPPLGNRDALGAHGYPFMIVPISTFTSRYSTKYNSLTFKVKQFSINDQFGYSFKNEHIPRAHNFKDAITKLNHDTHYSKISITWDLDNGITSNHIPNYVNRNGAIGEIDGKWPNIIKPANIFPNHQLTTNFSSESQTHQIPTNVWDTKNEMPVRGGNSYSFIDDFSTAELKSDKYLDTINEKFKFGKSIDGKTFLKVPGGISENGVLIEKSFREVSDPHNIASFRQPFILRPIPTEDKDIPGNGRWGFDPTPVPPENGGFLGEAASEFIGGFFRGAPTFTGLVERNLVDKVRIGKFLLTPAGIGFIGKQFVLQALNPTLESKIYNPLSSLSLVGGGDVFNSIGDMVRGDGFDASGIASALGEMIATAALPIGHPERHFGGGRYEDFVPLKTLPDFIKDKFPGDMQSILGGLDFSKPNLAFGSRIGMQSNPEIIKKTTINLGWAGSYTVGGSDLKTSLLVTNPNKYLFPISSAPKSIHKGTPSFTGTVDLADTNATNITTKKGGTFNKETSVGGLVTKHATLSYAELNKINVYDDRTGKHIQTPHELNHRKTVNGESTLEGDDIIEKRSSGWSINAGINGKDKINSLKYGNDYDDISGHDFIKFRFKDVINNKYIIFRAIIEGISDSINPEYGEEKYVGRPDKVYVYQGASREISFTFKIFPKSKQELPILIEKMNYLIGLCYPTYTESERMVTPFIELTIGDMFVNTPGLLSSLSMTVEDTSPWEIEDGRQFPHYITAQCSFKHIGQYKLHSLGKHYDYKDIPDQLTIEGQ